ncbi:hypothetical protein OJF2_63860 [Aquisphaera giovannonii]|uniref:Uncharacterized protein n=1 Tax=Aquisphaera giovannonii TaxID=406548 RepID=A0A5B9WCL4_9BACT|nr:hypothetical protein [Aquisphaera giovannonii]QEH37795.1 hypothetical protein OJF2_63860 [Aquisphaera giovannonii]
MLAIGLGAGSPARADGPPAQDVVAKGKVIHLATALERAGVTTRIDPEPVSRQVVLVDGDGAIVPLIPDEASRALFLDERLRGRPVEIKGKRLRGLPYLQVVTFKVEEDGRLRTPEYYCNVCTIHVRYPQSCPCCDGEMELRMKPEKD